MKNNRIDTKMILLFPLVFLCLYGFHILFYRVTQTGIQYQRIDYRIYDNLFTNPVKSENREYILFNSDTRIHKDLSEYHEVFRKRGLNISTFHTKDEEWEGIKPYSIDYSVNRRIQVCENDTFLLAVFPSRCNSREMRDLIRQLIPQNTMIHGKKVNHVFVVAYENNDRESIRRIRKENEENGDIIVSIHEDKYVLLTTTSFNAYTWIAYHCSTTQYVGKFDLDTFIFWGNLIQYLEHAPRTGYFGGRRLGYAFQSRCTSQKNYAVPCDYPVKRYVKYNSGGGILFSRDIIEYLVVGEQYQPLFVTAEDIMTGAVLNDAGIIPTEFKVNGCKYMIWVQDNHGFYSNYSRIPRGVSVFHHVKRMDKYQEMIQYFKDRIRIPDQMNCTE